MGRGRSEDNDKKEIKRLTREVERLNKLLRRYEKTEDQWIEHAQEVEEIEQAERAKDARKKISSPYKLDKCSKCKGDAHIKPMGPYTFRWCCDPSCNHRDKV
jgi:hypothetical protein